VTYSVFLSAGSTRVTDTDESRPPTLIFPIRHRDMNSRLVGRITTSLLLALSLSRLMMITMMIVTMIVNKLTKQ
jgi:hypothetical protein